ncbi:MAG TPA: polysaccharide deacetylase family protein [Bryobacterales bacterium]|nr:polysaccharide deacetylase family protein [Bryobacterales bacterium]
MGDPWRLLYYWRSRHQRAALFAAYDRKAHAAGLDCLHFVLSFDCDTPDDIEASEIAEARLRKMGVKPVYAVPGELLEQGRAVYGAIARRGAEFLNHGFREHVRWDRAVGAYRSCLFYDQISREEAAEDIRCGHAALEQILGVRPRGFRTPHFGTFQKRSQLRWLHWFLRGLGYEFSSSTMPGMAFRYGARFSRLGLFEFPLSGGFTYPLRLLDSWGCYRAPGRTLGEAAYRDEGRQWASLLRRERYAGILNYYVDPSHIVRSEAFFETVHAWTEAAHNCSYAELLPGAVTGCGRGE